MKRRTCIVSILYDFIGLLTITINILLINTNFVIMGMAFIINFSLLLWFFILTWCLECYGIQKIVIAQDIRMINILSQAAEDGLFMELDSVFNDSMLFIFDTSSADRLPFLINTFIGEKNDFLRIAFKVDIRTMAD